MTQALEVIDTLKRELKARGLTYAQVAKKIGMSEASVKRMFSERNFTLARLDQILTATGIEFGELTRQFGREEHLMTRLTDEQEREIVAEPKLFLVAVAVLNLMTYDDILAEYTLPAAEVVGLLTRLDRIGIIELFPNNKIRLKIARTFAWTPNGPIQQTFKNHAQDFFDSAFAGAGETMLLLNGRLSRTAQLALVDKLKRVAREFSAQHIDDSGLPLADRPPISLLLACRPWTPLLWRPFVRGNTRSSGRLVRS